VGSQEADRFRTSPIHPENSGFVQKPPRLILPDSEESQQSFVTSVGSQDVSVATKRKLEPNSPTPSTTQPSRPFSRSNIPKRRRSDSGFLNPLLDNKDVSSICWRCQGYAPIVCLSPTLHFHLVFSRQQSHMLTISRILHPESAIRVFKSSTSIYFPVLEVPEERT